jgi:hypothetical protein
MVVRIDGFNLPEAVLLVAVTPALALIQVNTIWLSLRHVAVPSEAEEDFVPLTNMTTI